MTEALTIATLPATSEPVPLRADVPVLIDPVTHYLPVPWDILERGAQLIATCPGVHPQLQVPANAMFAAYQAARWRMDPVMVATKMYFTDRKGGGLVVGYEAQLVHALVETDPDLLEPLDFLFGYSDPNRATAGYRFCKVIGRLRGARRPRTLTTPTVAQVKVKNSPLWYTDPDQQLSYYGARAWARRFRPGRLLGVYTRDEIETFRDTDGVHKAIPMFEEDEGVASSPLFDTVAPTDEDGKSFDRWEAKASGKGDSRDPREAGPPPADPASKPEGLDDDKAWVMAQRDRILGLEDPGVVATEGEKLVATKQFKRLVSYEQASAKAVDRAIRGRIDELNAR